MAERRRKARLKTNRVQRPMRSIGSLQNLTLSTVVTTTNNTITSPSLLPSLISIVLVFLVCSKSAFCNENENSHFALRPFQASPLLTRRQDGPSHSIPVLDLPSVSRLPQNKPNLVPILTAPVPRGSASSKPSFQRIRLNKPSALSTSSHRPRENLHVVPFHTSPQLPKSSVPHFPSSESPLTNFQSFADFSQPFKPAILPQSTPQQKPQPVLQASNDGPQRQSFRRIKPTSGVSRRIKPKNNNTPQLAPSRSSLEVNNKRISSSAQSTTAIATNNQHVRGRGPISAQDEDLLHKDNALDNEEESNFGHRVTSSENGSAGDNGILLIESHTRNPATSTSVLQSPPLRTAGSGFVHTPTIPLTYYTTFTYYTTVLRGPHTAMLSREVISTTTQVKPIDRSIVSAIELSDGYLQSAKTQLPLGTKTKGQTTTIYNVASRVQVFNNDLHKVIHATKTKKVDLSLSSSLVAISLPKASIDSRRIEPTRSFTSLPPILQSKSFVKQHIDPDRIKEIEKQDKQYLTRYTYSYTFIDGSNTKFSTRVEETAGKFAGNLAKFEPVLASSIDSEGLLSIIPTKSATIALGSRANGRMTTVVNLALNNYIKFQNLKNFDLHIKPTQVPSSLSPSISKTLDPSLIFNSFEEASSSTMQSSFPISLHSNLETPRLSSDLLSKSSQLPVIIKSSHVRERPHASRRPIRVKVKPIRSKLATLSRSVSSSQLVPSVSMLHESSLNTTLQTTSLLEQSFTSSVQSSTPILPSTTSLFVSPLPSPIPSTVASDLSPSSIVTISLPEYSSTETAATTPSLPTRRKSAFTIRKGASGINRYFNRRPSSYLVQHSSSVKLLSSSPTLKASSSIAEDSTLLPSPVFSSAVLPSVSLGSESTLPLQSSTQLLSSLLSPSFASDSFALSSSLSGQLISSQVLRPSRVTKSRLVVLTRLAGALNKWNPLHASRIRISSRKVLKSTALFDASRIPIESSSSVETIFDTTTHTVPFTIGSTTIFTTVEETNSRLVTRHEALPEDSEYFSPSFRKSSIDDNLLSSITPTVSLDITTQFNTLTHSNTIFTSGSSIDTSSEQTPSSVLATPKLSPASSTVVVETSDILTISTLYSTFTYFATLFNGTQTMITPLEEVKTEYLTLREPTTITRTILPDQQMSTTLSQSMETSILTTQTISGDIEPSSVNLFEPSFVTETHSTYTTLTHFITLFSGTRTILSSIEEISPTVLTKTRVVVPSIPTEPTSSILSTKILPTVSSSQIEPSMLLPSIVEISSSLASVNLAQPVYTIQTNESVKPNLVELSEIVPNPKQTEPISKQPFSTESVLYNKEQADKDVLSVIPILTAGDASTTLINEEHITSTSAVIEPGSVIELDDLLDGVQDAGQIGKAIKDIVNNIVIRPENMPAEIITTTPENNDDQSITTSPTTTESDAYDELTIELTTPLAPSFDSLPTNKKTTPFNDRYPSYIAASSKLPKQHMSNSDDKSMVIFSTQTDGEQTEPSFSTHYVTSIERSIKTLTLTSTKVYYTRDSPLTITSLLTTTLPPITYVSTIIGSKTILGTYNSITPTRTTSLVETSSSAIATSSILPPATTRPRLYRPKNQEQSTLLKAKVTPFLSAKKPSQGHVPTTMTTVLKNTTTFSIETEFQLCNPACNITNKEYCKENENGKYLCDCRPGYVRKPSDNLCQEIKKYLVVVRVSKTAESEMAANAAESGDLQMFARVARRQVGKMDGIAGLQVVALDRNTRSHSPMTVNLTVQLDRTMNNMHDDLTKRLQVLGQVEKVVDFDECSLPIHNDCSARARCINEPGSYRCQCIDNFIDLDQSLPGRLCVSEVKSCDYCYGRGECWRNQGTTVCRCHPMFIGRRCEINGLLLAIFVPIVAILVIAAIICLLYCSRKLRQRNRRFKNLAAYGPVAVIGGTLDRKAMLETSSESSDPQHRSSHYTNESNPASARGSMARRNGSRRESEPSLDRSLTSFSATGSHYNSLPPQILIPRARPPFTLHPGQVYMW